jgi:hypothetical protein
MANGAVTTAGEPVRCAECGATLGEGQDREVTDGGTFCRACFVRLTAELEQALAVQGRDVNYPMAALGAVLGGAAGAAVWWGFTVLTGIAFGLVAIVIGFAVGKGVLLLGGNKRAVGLQVLSAGVAALAFFYASYLVSRSFVLAAYAEQGTPLELPLLPPIDLGFEVVRAGFGVMDLVFLAITLWEAWKIPAPVRLGRVGGS